jgi:hypothetical protein
MSADASAYAVLGLEPNADLASVERAYKRLIKLYHPDREGGDGRRAAEIIHAYRDIRRSHLCRGELVLYEDHASGPTAPTGNAWVRTALAAAGAVLLLVLAAGPGMALVERLAAIPAPPKLHGVRPAVVADSMEAPLNVAAIDAAVARAVHVYGTKDENALVSHSRDCHQDLRVKPSLERLDSCAAFDDAVVELENRDPLGDQGPFSEIAVTGRQMSAGTVLSNDYLAIDGRLDRIRLHVELALAPPEARAPTVEQNLGL